MFGPKYGLPAAISGHQSYFLGDRAATPAKVSSSCMDEQKDLESRFAEVQKSPASINPYSMPYEHFDVFYCRGLKTASERDLAAGEDIGTDALAPDQGDRYSRGTGCAASSTRLPGLEGHARHDRRRPRHRSRGLPRTHASGPIRAVRNPHCGSAGGDHGSRGIHRRRPHRRWTARQPRRSCRSHGRASLPVAGERQVCEWRGLNVVSSLRLHVASSQSRVLNTRRYYTPAIYHCATVLGQEVTNA